jgi:HAD superfamily hydrolase (TIGR01509 family)
MVIAAVIFDLDGVLVDATEWHFEALNRALRLFGYQISRYEHLAAYNGLPTRTKLEMLSLEKGLPPALHGLIGRLKQVYTREEILRHCWPSFDKEYMLGRLKRDGLRMAVCTNAIAESAELMLQRAGIRPYFEFILSNEEISRPKPDPEIYQKALARLGIQPAQAVVVEDAQHGVEAARRAGIKVLQVSGFAEVDYWRLRAFLDGAPVGGGRSC